MKKQRLDLLAVLNDPNNEGKTIHIQGNATPGAQYHYSLSGEFDNPEFVDLTSTEIRLTRLTKDNNGEDPFYVY
jgi:hypothetical protein